MQKTESPAPTAPLDKKARRIRPLDVAIVVLFVAVVTALILVLLAQLRLKNEVADARAVTDKLITAMKDQDGEAARLLGDPGFRARNSADQMHTIFTESKPYTQGTPVVVRQVVVNGKVNHVVSIYYKFGSQKPFYVRVTALEPNHGHIWRVINFSGNQSLAELAK